MEIENQIPEFIKRDTVIVYVIIAFILGYAFGSGMISMPEEPEAIVDPRLEIIEGDKVYLMCGKEISDSRCSANGKVKEGYDGIMRIEWGTGGISKHCGKMLAEESAKHPNNDYFFHNISYQMYTDTRCYE